MKINIKYLTKPQNITQRVAEVAEAFGVGVDESIEHVVLNDYEFNEDFDVCYITGASGSGKSSLLRELKRHYGVEDVEFNMDSESAIVDLVGDTLDEALNLLSVVGLSEARIFVKRPRDLSDGQKYRYQLACMLHQKQEVLCIDEFTSLLDRTTAEVVAYNMQKCCRRNGVKLIVATAHNDLEKFLNPSTVINFGNDEDDVETNYWEVDCEYNPFEEHLDISEATKDDFKKLIKYHYKNVKTVPGTKVMYKLTYKGQLVGIAVYGCTNRMLSGRNEYFNKFYMTEKGYPRMDMVNKDFILGTRFVVSPQFRGCGFGSYLVKNTINKFDVPFVELISVMSNYNKFAQNGGFIDVGINESKKTADSKRRIIELLEKYGYSYDFLGSLEYCQEVIDNIPEEEIRKAFYPSIRSGLFIRKGLDLDKSEINALELEPSLLQLCKLGTTRYLLYVNKDKCEQCPTCGRWYNKEYNGCHFCQDESRG